LAIFYQEMISGYGNPMHLASSFVTTCNIRYLIKVMIIFPFVGVALVQYFGPSLSDEIKFSILLGLVNRSIYQFGGLSYSESYLYFESLIY